MKIKYFNEFFDSNRNLHSTPTNDVSLYVFHDYNEWLEFYEKNTSLFKDCTWSIIPTYKKDSEKYFNLYVIPGSVFSVVIDKSSNKVIGTVVKDGGILHSYDKKDNKIGPGEFQKYLSMLAMDIEDVEGFENN